MKASKRWSLRLLVLAAALLPLAAMSPDAPGSLLARTWEAFRRLVAAFL